MDIKTLKQGDILWVDAMEYALRCPWKAGTHLGEKMKNHQIKGWERVFVIYDRGDIRGFLLFAKKDCFPQLHEQPWIRYLFVDERCRGKEWGKKLIDVAGRYALAIGFPSLYLVSDHVGFYEKYGFEAKQQLPAPWDPSKSETIYEKKL